MPSPLALLVLVCLAIVHRFRPTWVALSLKEAAKQEGVSSQRISRLCSRALQRFASVLQVLTRKGRPPVDREVNQTDQELAQTKALLEISTSLLEYVSFRESAIRALIVAAFLRLEQQFPSLTKKQFCQTLALSERTFRHWRSNPHLLAESTVDTEPVAPLPAPKPPRKRSLRRPRFGFQCVLPDTQLATDTTDLSAFGVKLKLIATQDVGGRDERLLDSVVVDDHESADLVVQALIEALVNREGMQVITDQGTPYLAELTREAMETLGAEHAPQREYTPTAKATMERAFGTVKGIARPLLEITDRLADVLPQLRQTELAKAITTLVLIALLKAYQAGARAAHREQEARQGLSREDLEDAAREHREEARAEDRSKVLLLGEIHDLYDITRPRQRFIRALRRFPLEVLQAAEAAFRKQVHRDDIRDRASYFAAIVRRLHEQYRAEQARRRAEQADRKQQQQQEQQAMSRQQSREQNPDRWLREGLEALAAQWQPECGTLLFGGAGLGRRWLREALGGLIERHGAQSATDIAEGVFLAFSKAYFDQLGDDGLKAVRAVLAGMLPFPTPQTSGQSGCTQLFGAAIMGKTGPPPRSDPAAPLLTSAAKGGGS